MMNDRNMTEDTLSELRAGMEALKSSLPSEGIISDKELRQAMRGRSRWLNNVVKLEIIIAPIMVLILLCAVSFLGMNIWCMLVLIIALIPSIIFDTRTFSVSRKWIQDDSPVELSRKLARQKVERKRQTFIELPLTLAWLGWFMYEYMESLNRMIPTIPEDNFITVWAIFTGQVSILSIVIVFVIYRKAQRINDEMIRQINAFTGQE